MRVAAAGNSAQEAIRGANDRAGARERGGVSRSRSAGAAGARGDLFQDSKVGDSKVGTGSGSAKAGVGKSKGREAEGGEAWARGKVAEGETFGLRREISDMSKIPRGDSGTEAGAGERGTATEANWPMGAECVNGAGCDNGSAQV